ncbi:MAG: restriction endonuclease subunit M [Clostridia bacterium]|nr:restriction endonuclease subunit M [Clostridia bacterium]
MEKSQTKSKERVRERGEVFTAEREVKAMCDLVKDETERIDSRFLEPACGDGNFLAEILTRKLEVVKRKYKKSTLDYEKNAVLAISSVYGVDIMQDNVLACRDRLFKLWDKEYKSVCKKDCNDQTREAVKFILTKNIVCGNALTLKCVDENGNETDEPIVFSEWAFITGFQMQRQDYTFAHLLEMNNDEKQTKKQQSMFDEKQDEGKFLRRYVTHYRRVQENE